MNEGFQITVGLKTLRIHTAITSFIYHIIIKQSHDNLAGFTTKFLFSLELTGITSNLFTINRKAC